MSLLRLPPETLIQVMDHVGSSYFREDLGRLTVCKQWFIFARTACFKDLQLSQKTLRRLLSSRDVGRSLLLVKDSLEILDLELKGFEDWGSIQEPQSHPQDTNALDASSWDGDLGRALLAAWTTVLDNDLAQLAIIAKKISKITDNTNTSLERTPSSAPSSSPPRLSLTIHDTSLAIGEKFNGPRARPMWHPPGAATSAP